MKNDKIVFYLFLLSMIYFSGIFAVPASSSSESEPLAPESNTVFEEIKNSLISASAKITGAFESLNIDSNIIDVSINLPTNRGQISLKIPLESGLEFIEKGFDSAPINFSSPTLTELNIPGVEKIVDMVKKASFGATDLGNVRLLNVLLGVNLDSLDRTKTLERDSSKSDALKPIFDTAKKILTPAFKPFEKLVYVEDGVAYLKPVYVAGIKLVLLLKTYLSSAKDNEAKKNQLVQILPLFVSKFLNTVDFDASSKLKVNKTAKGALKLFKNWDQKTLVKYSDPAVLDKTLPKFIKDVVDKLALNVSVNEVYVVKDGITPYLTTLSETWKRGTVDSKAYYFIEKIVPLFKTTKMTVTDLYKTAFVILTMAKKLSSAKLIKDTTKRVISIIDSFIEVVNKTAITDKDIVSWKKTLVGKLDLVKKSIEKGQPVTLSADDIEIKEDKKMGLIELLIHYNGKLKSLLNYKHIGEPGYLFDLSMLANKTAGIELLAMLYRFYKDIKIAVLQANQLKSDISVKIDEKNVNLGPTAFANRVGKPGVWNSVGHRWISEGSGPIWLEQQAQVKMLDFEPKQLDNPNDSIKKIENPEFGKVKNEYFKAKEKTSEIKGKYIFDVARGIEISIGSEKKTPYSAMLSDLNILLRRVKDAKSVLESIENLYKSLGIPFPKATIEEDVKKSGISAELFMEEGLEGLDKSALDVDADVGSLDF